MSLQTVCNDNHAILFVYLEAELLITLGEGNKAQSKQQFISHFYILKSFSFNYQGKTS